MKFQNVCFRYILLILTIQITTASPKSKKHNTKRVPKSISPENAYELDDDIVIDSSIEENFAKLEVDILKCPNGCVCQYAHFMDLPVSRWINHLQQRQPTLDRKRKTDTSFEIENDNEAVHDGDENFLTNPLIKQATCILQEDSDENDLINSLPHDLQALILLYTGIGRNKTVNTSALKTLNQLTTLEIRGTQDRKLRLVFDEPLSFIQHANFESITIQGSDFFKRPKNPVHPKDRFDYKPKSEIDNIDSNRTGLQRLGFEQEPLEENEILPYNVYKKEMKKARMPNFYGWEHLEVLRIHSCQLEELYWEMFDGLDALQHLSLERNEIIVVSDFALYGAMHIKTLSLAHNRIHDLHYRALGGLLELEMLDLSDNRLNKLSELSFPPFPKLERIDFRQNPLRYIFPATFWVMNETRTMLFSSKDVALELWPNEPFESLRLLEELDIENVTIGVLEQYIFKGLSSLQKLKLRGDIRRIEFDAFAGLSELMELDMSYCQIGELSMDTLMGVRKLQILDLSYNNISYIPPGLFEDQNELTEIYMQGNQLRTLPTGFFKLPKLKLARLNENPWKCSCDMVNWRAKVANQVRDHRTERCITDFKTGQQISCRQVESFKFDKRYAPRCENYNGRSVFYVLRKQMKCNNKKIIKHRPVKQLQRNHRNSRQYGKQTNTAHRNRIETNRNRLKNDNRITWQIQREQKMQRKLTNENSLNYILKQGQQFENERHATYNENQDDISNDIF